MKPLVDGVLNGIKNVIRKIPERGQRAKCNPVDDVMDDSLTNKICQSESDHEWECCGISTVGSKHRCKKCGAYKTVPIESK